MQDAPEPRVPPPSCPIQMQSLDYFRAIPFLRASMAAFNLEQRSRAVCAAYKAVRGTLLGEDRPPTRKVTNSFKAKPCQAVKVIPYFYR